MTTYISKNGNETACSTVDDRSYCPKFDIWEDDEAVILLGDLPGVAPKDLEVQYEKGQLTIHASQNKTHDSVNFTLQEYRSGNYHRTFTVGESVDAENISAKLANGVLELRLPKQEALKPRKINVSSI